METRYRENGDNRCVAFGSGMIDSDAAHRRIETSCMRSVRSTAWLPRSVYPIALEKRQGSSTDGHSTTGFFRVGLLKASLLRRCTRPVVWITRHALSTRSRRWVVSNRSALSAHIDTSHVSWD